MHVNIKVYTFALYLITKTTIMIHSQQTINEANYVEIEFFPEIFTKFAVHSLTHGLTDNIYLMKANGQEFANHNSYIMHDNGNFVLVTISASGIDTTHLKASELRFSI